MKERVIIVGPEELGTTYLEEVIKKKFVKLVEADPKKEIKLLFQSCKGNGSLDEVLDLISFMRSTEVPIRTRNIGFIMSNASIFFLVGDEDKREGSPKSKINFHPVSIVLKEIRLDRLHEDFVELEGRVLRVAIRAVDFIESRTLLPRSEIVRLFSTRHPEPAEDFDLKAAQKYGLVTAPKSRQV
jgi:hypothetical protein